MPRGGRARHMRQLRVVERFRNLNGARQPAEPGTEVDAQLRTEGGALGDRLDGFAELLCERRVQTELRLIGRRTMKRLPRPN